MYTVHMEMHVSALGENSTNLEIYHQYHDCAILEVWLSLNDIARVQNVYPQNITDQNCQ